MFNNNLFYYINLNFLSQKENIQLKVEQVESTSLKRPLIPVSSKDSLFNVYS